MSIFTYALLAYALTALLSLAVVAVILAVSRLTRGGKGDG